MTLNTGLMLVAAAYLAVVTPSAAAELVGGVFADAPRLSSCCSTRGAELQVGARTDPIVSLTHFGDLRAFGLLSADSVGQDGFAAASLAWRLHLTPTLYLQPALGLAVQGGERNDLHRASIVHTFGARVLIEPELGVGYRLSSRWAVELSCVRLTRLPFSGSRNADMSNLGFRLIYRFNP